MTRISATRKTQVHENISLLMQLGVFSFLLIVSSWYNPKQSKQGQHAGKLVPAYYGEGQHKAMQQPSETSNQHYFKDELLRMDRAGRNNNP
jgi:hypothetical protein